MISKILKNIRQEINNDCDVADYDNTVVDGFRYLLNDCIIYDNATDEYTKTLVEVYTIFGVYLECGSSYHDYIETAVQTAFKKSKVCIRLKPSKKRKIIAELKKEIQESAVYPNKMLSKLDTLVV